MDSRNDTRAKMIVWLRDAIEHEISKPDDEIDYELVDEFSGLLSELMGDQGCLTEEDAKHQLEKIMQAKPVEVKRKPKIKLKRILTIACAALVLASAAVTISSFDGSARSKMWAAFTSDNGATFDEAGVTYIKMNNPTPYSSIEELVKKEELDIKYPKILPDGVKIESVIYDNTDSILIKFSDDLLQMEIYDISYMPMKNIIRNSSKIKINTVDTYIIMKNNVYTSYTTIDDNIYVITSNTEEKIKAIVSGLLGD